VDDGHRDTQSRRPPPIKGRFKNGSRSATVSMLSPGSGFRSVHMLAPFLLRHSLWAAFAERITDGAEFPLGNTSNDDRLADVTASLARANHKSASGHKAKLFEMLMDEVRQKEAAFELPHCEVAPMGMVSETTIGANRAKKTIL
jgi:hypothetical protein